MTAKLDFSTLNLQDALDLAVLIEKEAELSSIPGTDFYYAKSFTPYSLESKET